ncbi:helix-turn-helix domain-containing protein [Xanthomonas prunicola]|uniref:Helix-turn-helix domain-containing protein n=1 Tax=Xanthomonas prunicola TaxID=2053930 RepID=A0A9Q9MXW6_9XANT|nr:helix-turn-helix domain-containing protein [Xanthomonas prunicola]UXA66045.1 helix-turn-helix domain-containing protein [Xanthomonas prunicola]
MATDSDNDVTAHAAAIDALGGPSKLARRLGYSMPGGAQRVTNWRSRGIPSVVLLENAWLNREVRRQLQSAAQADGEVRDEAA